MKVVAAAVANLESDHSESAPVSPVFSRRNVGLALALYFIALASLLALQPVLKINGLGVSNARHFLYQAQSFLHGRWDLDMPAHIVDIVVIGGKRAILYPPLPAKMIYTHGIGWLGGKHYIVYPPLPAVLMMPAVAIFGLRTSDVLFTTLFAALNLPLLYLLFEQVRANGLSRRSSRENVYIAILLYFGSINLWLSLGGRMWFTAHVLCVTFTLLALLAAFRRLFGWSAVFLGCAFFCRATAALGFPLLLYLAWQDGGAQQHVQAFIAKLRARTPDWSSVPWRRLLPVGIGIAVTLLLFMARNLAVFGSPLESGYAILINQRYPVVKDGPFSLLYVPANVVANFLSTPQVIFTSAYDRHPVFNLLNGGYGVSVFITTPLFLFLFWRNRRFSPLRAALWATLGLVVAAVLLFHAAGWYQFGARYLYDGYPFAFLLLILTDMPINLGDGKRQRVDWRITALGMMGIVINILGAYEFWTGRLLHL